MWRKRFPKIRGQVVSLELELCNAPCNIVWLWPEWLWRKLESTCSLKIIFLGLGGGGVQVGFKIRHWIPTPWPPPLICCKLLQGFERQARHFMYGQCKSAKWTQIKTCYEGYMKRERHPGSIMLISCEMQCKLLFLIPYRKLDAQLQSRKQKKCISELLTTNLCPLFF